MKLSTLILAGILAFLSFAANAQSENSECERMKTLAKEAISLERYTIAIDHLLKAETNCNGLEQEYWERLFGCLKTVINEEITDQDLQWKYIDIILRAWDRQEDAGFYNNEDDLQRATYYMQSSDHSYEKADTLFQRGIKVKGPKTHESYIGYAYYSAYLFYINADEENKPKYKRRMISDYLYYSDLAEHPDSQISSQSRETLRQYFDYTFPTCEELLPEVQSYIDSLPKDTLVSLSLIKKLEEILDDRNCTQNAVYHNLIDTWLQLDPNSFYARLRKIENTTKGGIEMMDSLLIHVKDSAIREEIQYQKAYAEYKAGQYKAAYASGLKCTGSNKPKGLLISAQCVATTASSCGESTFDRKCNYIYAAQLAEKGGFFKPADAYRAKGPSIDCSPENAPKLVKLSCWGVTVNLCP